jgi:putative DNA primase/helicase
MDAAKSTAPPPNGQGPNDTTHRNAYIESLSLLSKIDYECKRLEAAEALGFRVSALDEIVAGMRPKEELGKDNLQGEAIEWEDIELWPEPVNGAELLNRVVERIELYLVLPPGAAVVMGLWCLSCYLYDCFDVFPRLNISSPTKRCGKTLTGDVLSLFCPRPLSTEDATTAALFRIIPKYHPTVFFDEFDTLGDKGDDYRAILNASHRRNGKVLRTVPVGDGFEVRAFSVYCPVVVIGIGTVYDTLLDRSITIRLERATKEEIKNKKRFNFRDLESEKNLARQLARLAADSRVAVLAHGDPKLPEEIYSREADNLRPLATVAEIVGEGWPLRLITAYANLCGDEGKGESDGLRIELLRDIREVLREREDTNIFSQDLTDALCSMPDRPWHELNRGKSISATWLAKQLKTFRIISKSVRVGDNSKKGYRRADFEDVFERYLDRETDLDVSKRHSVTEAINIDESKELETSHAIECDGTKSHENPVNVAVCRCDVSNVENGNGHTKAIETKSDRLWRTAILPRRMCELGKTEAEIALMTEAEMERLSNESF